MSFTNQTDAVVSLSAGALSAWTAGTFSGILEIKGLLWLLFIGTD